MLEQHLILALLWILFCVLHSLLAATQIKKFIAAQSSYLFKNYRFSYTLFAFASLGAVIYFQLQLKSPLLFIPSAISNLAGYVLAITGGIIMVICIKKYFLSLSGLKSLVAEQVVANELRIDGIHQYVRHPLYLGTFLFIWGFFLLYPFLSLGIADLIITVYTLLAIRLEEEKLIQEFGAAYIKYKELVPTILPNFKSYLRK